MNRIRLCAIVAMAWSALAGTAHAYDWDRLDKLSGPGGFVGLSINYRFLCVGRSSDQRDFNEPDFDFRRLPNQASEPNQTFVTRQGVLERSAGIWPAHSRSKPDLAMLRTQNAGLSEAQLISLYRRERSAYDCSRDNIQMRNYATVTFTYSESTKNDLFLRNPHDDRGDVRLLTLSWDFSHRLNRVVDVSAGVAINRFSGEIFDPFYRWSVTAVSWDFAPVAAWKDSQAARALKIKLAVTMFLTGFDANDFCNTDTRFCSNSREYDVRYEQHRELVPQVRVFVDPVVFLR